MKSIDLMSSWMVEVNMDPDLRECMENYAKERGMLSMSEICHGMDHRFRQTAVEQDKIGWRRFMEGMVSMRLREIQTNYSDIEGSHISPTQWCIGAVIKLMESTHGQWLYRCVQVHDRVQGTRGTQRKDELHWKIEVEQDLGYNGLLEEDQYLAEVNLDYLELSSGERQEYWLVAIRTAREAGAIQRTTWPQQSPYGRQEKGV